MRTDIWSIKRSTSVAARTAIEDVRRRLEKMINSFHKNGDTYLGHTNMWAGEFDDDSPLEKSEN